MNEHIVRGAALTVVIGILLAAVLAWAGYFFYCPCAVVPGGWLLGEEFDEPVSDWSSANDVGLCQVQVAAGLPHSVNVNCMASEGKLFLSCSNCMGKRWSSAALAEPRGRIRIGDAVYPVTIKRVKDPATLDEAWLARSAKLGRPIETPRAVGWWSFQIESR